MDMVEVPLKMASTSRDGAIMYKNLGFVCFGGSFFTHNNYCVANIIHGNNI